MIFRKKSGRPEPQGATNDIKFGPGVNVREGPGGKSVILPATTQATASSSGSLSYWIRLGAGGSGGFYDYSRTVRDPDTGIWTDTGQVGMVGGEEELTAAHEVNDFVGLLSGKVVRAFPTPGTFGIEFQAEHCEEAE